MDEDFIEDCRQAGLEDIHPRLRNKYLRKPERATCRACGFEPYAPLTEDGLCRECSDAVTAMEQGRLP
jgi:hypothetical protein